MTGHAVTTNPLLIMLINMTIVFGVLWILGYVIRLIHFIDPTKKKEEPPVSVAAAPIAAATETQEVDEEAVYQDRLLVAVVTTAIMAYGYQNVKVKSIKKV